MAIEPCDGQGQRPALVCSQCCICAWGVSSDFAYGTSRSPAVGQLARNDAGPSSICPTGFDLSVMLDTDEHLGENDQKLAISAEISKADDEIMHS